MFLVLLLLLLLFFLSIAAQLPQENLKEKFLFLRLEGRIPTEAAAPSGAADDVDALQVNRLVIKSAPSVTQTCPSGRFSRSLRKLTVGASTAPRFWKENAHRLLRVRR